MGEVDVVFRAQKLSLSYDNNNAEALNNLGILEIKRNNFENAIYHFKLAIKENPYQFEPNYNLAINSFKMGKYQEAYESTEKALGIYPDHIDSILLLKKLKAILL